MRCRQEKERQSLAHVLLGAIGILVVAFAVCSPALTAGLVWDDATFVLDNVFMHDLDGLRQFWFSSKPTDYFPLTSTMFWIQHRLWGSNPAGFHFVNILLHAFSAALLWRLLARWDCCGRWGAWLAGLIFAAHPVAVVSAAWISEGKNTLSMLLMLSSLWFYLNHEERPRWRSYGLALGFFLLALLAKTSVATMPAVLLILIWWRRGRIEGKDMVRALPFFAVAAVLSLATIHFSRLHGMTSEPARPEQFFSRLAGTGWEVWFYLAKDVLPFPLMPIYERWEISGANPIHYAPLAALAVCLAAFWRWRHRWGRGPLAALASFVVILLPVLGFFPISFMRFSLVADHWQYLALPVSVAFVVGALAAASRLAGPACRLAGKPVNRRWSPRRRAAARGAAAAVVVALGLLGWLHAHAFANTVVFWKDALSRNPDCWRGMSVLGEKTAGVNPTLAAAFYEKTLSYRPTDYTTLVNYGLLRLKIGDPQGALELFDLAVASHPRAAAARFNRGHILFEMGNYEGARRDFVMTLRLDPYLPGTHYVLGLTCYSLDLFDEAIAYHTEALRRDPAHQGALENRAKCFARLGNFERAWKDVHEVERLGGVVVPAFKRDLQKMSGRMK